MLTVKSLPENIIGTLTKTDNGYYSTSTGNWINTTNVHTYDNVDFTGPLTIEKASGGNGGGYIAYFEKDGSWIEGHVFLFENHRHTIDSAPVATDYVAITFWNNQSGQKIIVDGQEYPAQATVNKKQVVNGEQNLSLSFSVSEMNMDFLSDLSFNWVAKFQQEDYTIINPSIEAIVKRKSITAILKFFTDFGGMYLQDEVEDKSMTALNAYTELFANTGKRVHLVDNFYSNTLNYSKNQSRLERFHYYNERFNAEFIVRGDDVYLYNNIGSYKPDVRIDEDLNVKSASVEIDSENFFTWCKCYYDLEQSEDGGAQEENYRQEAVYTDSDLFDQYGEIEGPALYQGNIRHENTMLEYARDQQRKSISVSHSVDLVDLQRQGYAEFIFQIGDTVRLSLSSINITVDIRIVDIDETWVENDLGEWERTDFKLTLGEVSKVQSYKSSRSSALQELDDWLRERKPIPPNLLAPMYQRAADIINGDTDSVMDYRKDRLIGYHSSNKDNNVQLNVSGLQYVRNGVPGAALTFEGLVVDTATTGILNTHNVLIQGTDGHFTIDGDMLKATSYSDPEKYFEITPDGAMAHHGFLGVTRDDAYTDSNGKEWGVWMQDGVTQDDMNIQRNQFTHPEYIDWTGQRYALWAGRGASTNTTYSCETFYVTHTKRYITVGVGLGYNLTGDVASNYVIVEIEDINTGEIVANTRVFKYSTDDTTWHNLTFEIGAPDFQTQKAYMIRLGSSLLNHGAVTMLPNRARLHG